MGESPPLAEEDALAEAALRWFKASFFHWVNSPACSTCGSGSTQLVGTRGPTAEEAGHGAVRTEVRGLRAGGVVGRDSLMASLNTACLTPLVPVPSSATSARHAMP